VYSQRIIGGSETLGGGSCYVVQVSSLPRHFFRFTFGLCNVVP
jgi:hypothetical protein